MRTSQVEGAELFLDHTFLLSVVATSPFPRLSAVRPHGLSWV